MNVPFAKIAHFEAEVERQSERVSRWETSSIRSTLEKSEEIFQKAEAQFFAKKEENHDMHIDFQRQSWTRLLKKIRKWERLPAEDYDGWWPTSHEEESTWVAALPKLPPTREGEFVNGTMIVEKKTSQSICKNRKSYLINNARYCPQKWLTNIALRVWFVP